MTIKTSISTNLHKTLWAFLYLLPAVLFFSYYPIISLGANSSMNFELSLPLIWLVLFDLVAFFTLLTLPKSLSRTSQKSPKNHPKLSQNPASPSKKLPGKSLPGISDRRIFLFSLFPFFLTLSVFWSPNPLRGLLTAGIVWLLFFAVFTIIFVLPLLKSPKNLRSRLLASLFLSTAAVCVFCFIQSILDTCGLPRTETLLCAGCTYRSFGFPHPSGFAIEPQFMGNLLLAPTLTALYLLIFRRQPKTPKIALILLATLFSTTLFFTFSRGAIYAYAVALLVLFIFSLLKKTFRPSLIVIPIVTFLLSLGLQGTFAAFGPTSETFASAVTKSIHQLSLGLIDLRPLAKAPSSSETTSSSDLNLVVIDDLDSELNKAEDHIHSEKTDDLIQDFEHETAHFEGYVAESTNIRLNLNSVALATSLQSPGTFLFGVGLGGAGAAMFEAFPDKIASPKEIVQNEPFSLLLETGLVGLFLAHFALVLAFLSPLLPWWFIDGKSALAAGNARRFTPAEPQGKNFLQRQLYRLGTSDFWSHPALPLLASLIVAYLITLNFFSGLPNALQIYLMPPLLFFMFRPFPSPVISSKASAASSKSSPKLSAKSL